MARAALAILSTENLLHNISVIRERAPQSKIIAMVKANAYGHGLRSVSRRIEHVVDSLGVASIDEAIALRKAGIRIPITLMEGVFEPDELLVASCERFHVVFHHITQVSWLQNMKLPLPLTAWLKIDTGLGRLGFACDDAEKAYELLSRYSSVEQPIGIMSHFACADQPEHMMNQQQLERFRAFTNTLPGPRSLLNSAGIFAFPEHCYDVVRPGLALYGMSPFAHISGIAMGLKPVMSMHTRLISVRYAKKGDSIGYGSRFMCPEDMPIGVIALGYGDIALRTARDGMPVMVNGERCALVGRVSMDMMTVDLRAAPTAAVGDPVTLWGDGLSLEEITSWTDHVPYDLLTGIQSRVVFHWTQDAYR